MPKYWVKNYFAHGRFPEVGQKQKTEERERKKERLNDGNNNGQATHGARKPPGPKRSRVLCLHIARSLKVIAEQNYLVANKFSRTKYVGKKAFQHKTIFLAFNFWPSIFSPI